MIRRAVTSAGDAFLPGSLNRLNHGTALLRFSASLFLCMMPATRSHIVAQTALGFTERTHTSSGCMLLRDIARQGTRGKRRPENCRSSGHWPIMNSSSATEKLVSGFQTARPKNGYHPLQGSMLTCSSSASLARDDARLCSNRSESRPLDMHPHLPLSCMVMHAPFIIARPGTMLLACRFH